MTARWPDDRDSAAILDRAVSASRLLVALDFDGTLAPHADDPDACHLGLCANGFA